jgi:hypothetical protein
MLQRQPYVVREQREEPCARMYLQVLATLLHDKCQRAASQLLTVDWERVTIQMKALA